MPPESHFLSDVHLPFEPDPLTDRFLAYLASCEPGTVSEIFLLGDIFHYWVHDSGAMETAYADVLSGIGKAVERGIRVHFFPGNRDFLLSHSPVGRKAAGLECHQGPEVVSCGKRRFYVGHGDELCVGDTGYMIWRKVSRNPFVLALFNRLPESWRVRTVERLSQASRERGSSTQPPEIPTDLYRRIFRRGADTIIHGHLHQALQRKHEYPPGRLFVLDAWEDEPNVLVYDHETDEFTVRVPDEADA